MQTDKRRREMYRRIPGSRLCPAEALNPSVGQSVLPLPLIGIWTKGARLARPVLASQGRAWKLLASPEETGLFTGLQSVSREAGGLCQGGAPWRSPGAASELTAGGGAP